MKIDFDRKFEKDFDKLPTEIQDLVKNVIRVSDTAQLLSDLSNIKKLKNYKNYYRIKIGITELACTLTPMTHSYSREFYTVERFIDIFPRNDNKFVLHTKHPVSKENKNMAFRRFNPPLKNQPYISSFQKFYLPYIQQIPIF